MLQSKRHPRTPLTVSPSDRLHCHASLLLYARRQPFHRLSLREFSDTHLYFQYPENASFLTEAERDWLLETIRGDTGGLSKHFKREFVIQALRDPQAYIHAAIFFLYV